MNYRIVIQVLSLFSLIFSASLIPPLIISWYANDGMHLAFFYAWLIVFLSSVVCYICTLRHNRDEHFYREGFLIVFLFWFLLGSFGAIPYLLGQATPLSVTDAFFESISALTTTGSTILTDIDSLPISIKYYRQQTQWLGGVSLILLALSILPYLGIGGMQLYRMEQQTEVYGQASMHRLSQTARMIGYPYLTLTVACALGYWATGMDAFDALMHSFSTVSIGGFSTHTEGMGYFDSPLIWMVASIFMLLSAINFVLHYQAFQAKSLKPYLKNSELSFFLSIIAIIIFATVALLWMFKVYDSFDSALVYGIFQAVSIATTTGFSTDDFSAWPATLPILLLVGACIGCCGGSAGGGIKVIRILIVLKHITSEVRRVLYPNAISSVKVNRNKVPVSMLTSVWSFLSLYLLCFILLSLMVSATGTDVVTAVSTVLSCLNNMGPALGLASENYASLPQASKWILMLAMFLGRLELFTILVLVLPAYWLR